MLRFCNWRAGEGVLVNTCFEWRGVVAAGREVELVQMFLELDDDGRRV